MLKGITPWELPCYRIYGLIIFFMLEGKEPEQVEVIEEAIRLCDKINPFKIDHLWSTTSSSMAPRTSGTTTSVRERPIEDVKRDEATAAGKPFYVPPWWRGEAVNAKVAQSMMGAVPKEVGGEVR